MDYSGYLPQEILGNSSTTIGKDRTDFSGSPPSYWLITEWSFKPRYKPSSYLFEIDPSSIRSALDTLGETSSSETYDKEITPEYVLERNLAKAMLCYDSIGLMPPRKKRRIKLNIKQIRRGELPDFEPGN